MNPAEQLQEQNNSLKEQVEKLKQKTEAMNQEYAKTIEQAETHFRNYRARLEEQIEEKNLQIEKLKTNKPSDSDEIEAIKEKFTALKEGVLKEIKEYQHILVRNKICSADEVKKRGTTLLSEHLAGNEAKMEEEKKRYESSMANLQRKIVDLEAKNQNLNTMIEYTREQNNNPEYKKCQDYIKELEKRLASSNEPELAKLKDEITILKAENTVFSKEKAMLQRKLDNMSKPQSNSPQQQAGVPSNPLFLQNFISNLESLLNEKESKVQPLEDKYIQTADKVTKPIFQRIIDLKSSASAAKPPLRQLEEQMRPSRQTSSANLNEEEIGLMDESLHARRRFRAQKTHPNYTYEREIENIETLESIIFEQEDYIQKLETAVDKLYSGRRDHPIAA